MKKYLCFHDGIQTEYDTIIECKDHLNSYLAYSTQYLTEQPTLSDLFTIPVASDLYQMFSLGFGLPVLAYFVAHFYQLLISFLDKD